MRRILTAAVIVPILWAIVKLAPAWAFAAAFALGIACGVHEAFRMLERSGRRPFTLLGGLATLALAWSFSGVPPGLSPLAPLLALVVVAWLAALARREDPTAMLDAVSATLFPVVAIGLPLSFMVAIRALPFPDGEDLLLLLIVCVAFGDTAAYYVGSAIGRRPLAPRLSPKKSWEGAIGGVAGAVLGALLGCVWFYQRLPIGHGIALGVLLGACGILGDLSESMVKRALGAKDASALLPGHGGLLDRLDSLMLSAPAAFAYWHLFLDPRSGT